MYEKLRQKALKMGSEFGEFIEEEYDKLGDFFMPELKKEGVFSVIGTVPPLADFIAWKTEKERLFDVELPDGKAEVRVMLMDDFISFGWIGFATLDQLSVGGWPNGDLLYAVESKNNCKYEGLVGY